MNIREKIWYSTRSIADRDLTKSLDYNTRNKVRLITNDAIYDINNQHAYYHAIEKEMKRNEIE